jgi:hypothetical protein
MLLESFEVQRFYPRLSNAIPWVIFISFGVVGCSRPVEDSKNNAEKARARGLSISSSSKADDVRLASGEREDFFKMVEEDSVESDENTMLLVGIAYRNADEKKLLVSKLPEWFRSTKLDTRCMAFKVVKFLNVPGFREQVVALRRDIEAKGSLNPMWQIVLSDVKEYIEKQ